MWFQERFEHSRPVSATLAQCPSQQLGHIRTSPEENSGPPQDRRRRRWPDKRLAAGGGWWQSSYQELLHGPWVPCCSLLFLTPGRHQRFSFSRFAMHGQ